MSGRTNGSAAGNAGAAASQDGRLQRGLDWREAQARLGVLRHRWDLAILCNLDPVACSRPAGLLAAVNSQSGADRRLSPQVLSVRLREMEHAGYIRHEDLSVIPLHRVYYLQPSGRQLIADVARIIRPCGEAREP